MNTIMPLLIILIFALLNAFLSIVRLYKIFPILSSIILFALCFSVGLFFNQTKKKTKTWVLKVIITLVLIFCFLVYQGWWPTSLWHSFLDIVLWKDVVIPLIVIWCGWAFFR